MSDQVPVYIYITVVIFHVISCTNKITVNYGLHSNDSLKISDDDNYVCTLDEASKERAGKELNEDEKNRDGAVETLRDWVKQQHWLKSPTGR